MIVSLERLLITDYNKEYSALLKPQPFSVSKVQEVCAGNGGSRVHSLTHVCTATRLPTLLQLHMSLVI